jgi:oxalate decarboxylase/phosphoglucose isomerase-like protein (cupin superfamily)
VTTPQAIINVQRCGAIAFHYHPRGTEQLLVTAGRAEVGLFLEDNTLRRVNLTQGQAVIIPAGSVHYTRNTGNGPLQMVQTFDNPLSGSIFLAPALLAMDRDLVNSNLNTTVSRSAVASSNIFSVQGCRF